MIFTAAWGLRGAYKPRQRDMKNRMMLLAVLLVMAMTGLSQQIAVVSSSGSTTVHQTLKDAIESASNGSVIYLPGGGFNIADSVKITHRVTIVGIGHKATNDNADGNTIINGNLWFNTGSDGSAVMGCYISGEVNIAEDGPVNDVLVKLCNAYKVRVRNGACTGTVINQNYLREDCWFSGSAAHIHNNVIDAVCDMTGGVVENNIITGYGNYSSSGLQNVDASQIKGNIVLCTGTAYCDNNAYSGNLNVWDDPVNIDYGGDINNLFVYINNWGPLSNFRFKDDFKQYESQVGVYAGTGFSAGALPPVPYIVAKRIAEETDAAGKLKVQVRVNAGNTSN